MAAAGHALRQASPEWPCRTGSVDPRGVFASLIATHQPLLQNFQKTVQLPYTAHFFWTDDLGWGIYSRLVHGARITLTIMFLVAIVVRPIRHLFGTVAGYFGGCVDTVLMRSTDIFLSFPSLILSLAFVAAWGPSLNNDHRHVAHRLAADRASGAG